MDVVEFDEVPGDEDASKPDVAPPEFDDLLEGVATTEPKDLTADRASRPRTLLKMTACLRLRRPYVDDAEKATADEEPFEFEEGSEDSEENEARELDKSVEELCNDSGGEGGASEMSQPTEKVIKCPSKWRSPEELQKAWDDQDEELKLGHHGAPDAGGRGRDSHQGWQPMVYCGGRGAAEHHH